MTKKEFAMDSPAVSQKLYQAILDGVADPIMVIDNNYQIILLNRAAKRFAVDEDSLSQPILCHQLSHHQSEPCDGEAHPCPLKQVRRSGQPATVIHEHYQANGNARTIEVRASPLSGAGGEFLGIIESMRDVTERHQSVMALRQYTDRLRSLSAQLAEVSEAERRRLSQELHDQVGQNLTALGINLNIIRTEAPAGASASLLSRLDDSLLIVEQTTQRIRDVMADLRPPLLDDYGLLAALQWYGRRFSQRTNIAISVVGEEPSPRLVPRLENVFFRIAQEALTNVTKHAQAAMVVVTIVESNGHVSLVIADDGIGFDPTLVEHGDGNQGWGIITMMERAEAEGGRCRIESGSGDGTRVIVKVTR